MEHNCKNYRTDGGDTLIIGGKLIVESGAAVEGIPGGVAANQAASTASTVAGMKDDFNTLLASLKAAGIMAADTGE